MTIQCECWGAFHKRVYGSVKPPLKLHPRSILRLSQQKKSCVDTCLPGSACNKHVSTHDFFLRERERRYVYEYIYIYIYCFWVLFLCIVRSLPLMNVWSSLPMKLEVRFMSSWSLNLIYCMLCFGIEHSVPCEVIYIYIYIQDNNTDQVHRSIVLNTRVELI